MRTQTPPRRARRVNDFEGRIWGHFSHNDPSGAARRGLIPFSLSLERANADPEENGTTLSPRNPTPSLGTTKTTLLHTTKDDRG